MTFARFNLEEVADILERYNHELKFKSISSGVEVHYENGRLEITSKVHIDPRQLTDFFALNYVNMLPNGDSLTAFLKAKQEHDALFGKKENQLLKDVPKHPTEYSFPSGRAIKIHFEDVYDAYTFNMLPLYKKEKIYNLIMGKE